MKGSHMKGSHKGCPYEWGGFNPRENLVGATLVVALTLYDLCLHNPQRQLRIDGAQQTHRGEDVAPI